MKRFTIWFITLISTMLLVCFVFAMVVDAEEKYQCFAGLYPELAEKHQIPKLNETYTYEDGVEYFVLAECKHMIRDTWFLWFDISDLSPNNKLDGFCDTAISLQIIDGELIIRALPCDHAYEMVFNYCKENNIGFKEFIH